MSHPAPLAAAVHHLKAFPVSFAHSTFGPAPLHVVGRPNTPLARLSVYLHDEDLSALAQELPGHLRAPPVWTAWLACRAPHPLEWTWGYQQARRLTLPHGGVFKPRASLEPDLHCQHPDPDITHARLHGMLSYLVHLPGTPLAPTLPTPNAAD